jgi:uncharacterized Ntn-hydrolase superfamily protein
VTFSIVACDLERGDWGVAVASKFPAVGAVVPWAKAGVGAVATQSFANTDYGVDGIAMMGAGRSARAAIDALTAADDDREQRQVGAVDRLGLAASFSGAGCMQWAGGLTGEGFACQGNILSGEAVVDALARTFAETEGELVDRLVAALVAGENAGGDRRGKQSAAVLVVRERGGYGGRNDRYIDLRVDDHEEPVRELVRLFERFDREYLVRDDPLLELDAQLVAELQRRLASIDHYAGPSTGQLDTATRGAIAAFAGRYNLEAKVREDDMIFGSLLREIRDVSGIGDDG